MTIGFVVIFTAPRGETPGTAVPVGTDVNAAPTQNRNGEFPQGGLRV